MLTCESVEALVVREADGLLLTPAELAGLEAHSAGCQACRELREANVAVTRAMALRTGAPVPGGFAPRVLARVAPGRSLDWLGVVDWRRWTEWMLPVAAGLLLAAGVAGSGMSSSPFTSTVQPASSESSAPALDSWTWSDESDAMPEALRQDVTSDDLLSAMLGKKMTDAGGSGDAR